LHEWHIEHIAKDSGHLARHLGKIVGVEFVAQPGLEDYSG